MTLESGLLFLAQNPAPWHFSSWLASSGLAQTGNIPHALIVSGHRGIGKAWFAESLARGLLCLMPVADGSACGTCKSCLLINAGSHPDVRMLAPEDSRFIKVDQVRNLIDFVMRSPQVSKRKVVLVSRADQLNINAANGLLKTLEEPPADTVLLLLHRQGQSVLPTIRSRCQYLPLVAPARQVALEWLATQLSDDAAESVPDMDRLQQLLDLTGGAPLLALALYRDDWMDFRSSAANALRGWLKSELALSDAAKIILGRGQEMALELLEQWIWELSRVAVGALCREPDLTDMLSYLASKNHPAIVQSLQDDVLMIRKGMVNNLAPELAVERHLLLWRTMMPRRNAAAVAGNRSTNR